MKLEHWRGELEANIGSWDKVEPFISSLCLEVIEEMAPTDPENDKAFATYDRLRNLFK